MTTKTTTTLSWIDVMGLPHQQIEALVLGEKVFVDQDTLDTMAASNPRCTAHRRAEHPRVRSGHRQTQPFNPYVGMFDVTEIGGGWDMWRDLVAIA